jgi:hypothetical protein
MHYNRILTSAALLATLSFTVTPAFAQRNRGSGASRGSSGAGAARASAPRSSQPARSYGVAVPRATRGVYSSGPRAVYSGQTRGVYTSRGVYRYPTRGVYPYQSRAVYRYPSRVVYPYQSRYVSHGVYAAPYRYYRPYYSFRPRFSIGFGLWIGYPVVYTSPYYYGYPYPGYYGYPAAYAPYAPTYYPPPAYGYPGPRPVPAYPAASYPPAGAAQPGYYEPDLQQGSVIAQPGTASGSVSFEITPSTAEAYIDGKYVGRVSDLGPTTQPLALTPGRHRVEIRAAGYQTLTIDADVVAGQVIPYRGTMQVAR